MSGLVGGRPTPWLGLLVLLAAAAPWYRARLAGAGIAPPALATGTVAAMVALSTVALGAGWARDRLGTSDAALRAAVGLVVVVVGVMQFARPRPRPVDLRGRQGALGLAFPVLVAPETVLAVASVSVDHGPVLATTAAAAALAVGAAVIGRSGCAPTYSVGRASDLVVRTWASGAIAIGVLAVYSGVVSV